MKAKAAEKWAWLLIYSGLGLAVLGWFLRAAEPMAGALLMIVGALDAIAGAALVYWRSRLPDATGKEKP